jgi:hypothetical protein
MPVIWTNKHNLPEQFKNALMVDEHVSLGDISVTQLIDAPQIRMLKKANSYEMDIMDLIGMAMGTGLHTILERGDMKGTFDSRVLQRAAGVLRKYGEDKGADYLHKVIKENLEEIIDTDVIVEKTMTMEVLGWTLSGTMDRYIQSAKELNDYKMTGATAVMFPEAKKLWDAQLNIYTEMLRELGFDVEKAKIIAVLKDWSKMKILSNPDYPKTPVIQHEVKLIDRKVLVGYIEKRVRLHQRADAGEVIPCTKKDQWAKPDMFKVYLEKGKRQLKSFLSQKEADGYIESNSFRHSKPLEVRVSYSEPFRCANGFCAVSEVCPQYQKEKELAANKAERI